MAPRFGDPSMIQADGEDGEPEGEERIQWDYHMVGPADAQEQQQQREGVGAEHESQARCQKEADEPQPVEVDAVEKGVVCGGVERRRGGSDVEKRAEEKGVVAQPGAPSRGIPIAADCLKDDCHACRNDEAGVVPEPIKEREKQESGEHLDTGCLRPPREEVTDVVDKGCRPPGEHDGGEDGAGEHRERGRRHRPPRAQADEEVEHRDDDGDAVRLGDGAKPREEGRGVKPALAERVVEGEPKEEACECEQH